jgi:hypothetical protein
MPLKLLNQEHLTSTERGCLEQGRSWVSWCNSRSWQYKICVLCDHCVFTPALETNVFKQHNTSYLLLLAAAIRRVPSANFPTKLAYIFPTVWGRKIIVSPELYQHFLEPRLGYIRRILRVICRTEYTFVT